MPVLTIGGTAYDVQPGELTHESAVRSRRTFSRKLRTVETMNGTVRSFHNWPWTIPNLTLDGAEALADLLNGTALVPITGDLPGASINIRAVNVEVLPGPLEDEASVQFLAREA